VTSSFHSIASRKSLTILGQIDSDDSSSDVSHSREGSRQPWIAFAVVVSVYIAAVLLLPNPNIPLNDDWMYARTVRVGLETGHMSSTGYQTPWGIPHFILGTALSSVAGLSHSYLRWLSVVALLFILMFLTLVLARHGASFGGAVLLLSSVTWFAPFFLLSFTFMTDVVFLLFWVATLYFWERAHSEGRTSSVYIGTVWCTLAILQRQTGIALVLANIVLLYSLPGWRLSERRSLRCQFVSLSFGLLLAAGAVSVWWNGIPIQAGSEKPRVLFRTTVGAGSLFTHLFLTIPYFGWFFLPVLVSRISWPRVRQIMGYVGTRSPLWKAGAVLWICLPFSIAYALGRDETFMPYIGNVISQWGTFRPEHVSTGSPPLIFCGFLTGWTLTLVLLAAGIACVSAFTRMVLPTLAAILKAPATASYVSGLFSIVAGLAYYASLLPIMPFFDRYLLPLFFAIAMAYAFKKHTPSLRRTVIPGICAVGLAIMAWTLTHDFVASSETRWRAAEWALKTGRAPVNIDGGYEWLGWRAFILRTLKRERSFTMSVSTSVIPGFTTVHTESYYSFWPPHQRTLYVLAKD
jgi:hypothetical protein